MSSPFSTECPPELLVKCFFYCVYADVPDMDPDSAPVLLARVCRRWREVILETPLLWSRFRLRRVTNHSNEIRLSSQVHSPALIAFGRHLQRSKSMPLTCSLRDSTEAGGGHYDPFFLRLLEEAERWYDIALGGPYRQSDVHVAAHPTSFPKLQSIQILDWPNDASTSLRSIFTSSPKIKRIALKVPYICDCLKLVPSLSQLTTLKIWKTSNVAIEWRQEEHEPHLFSILSQCTSLESLSIGTFLYSQIEFEPGGFDEQQIQAPLTLPSLRFFSFPISDLDFPSIYLRALTFPNLSELEISPTYRLNLELARHRDDLMNFVRRHGALGTVRKLTLGLPPSAEMECRMEILEHFPNVVEVDLAESEPYLSESEGFDGGEVRLAHRRWNAENSTQLAQFVESRWKGPVDPRDSDTDLEPTAMNRSGRVERLRCLRMGVDAYACLRAVNEDAIDRIQRCVDEGFDLEPVRSRRWSLGQW